MSLISVAAFPDVIVRDLTEEHEFIILACDGIWDVMTNQEVVDFCRDRVSAGMEPEKASVDITLFGLNFSSWFRFAKNC